MYSSCTAFSFSIFLLTLPLASIASGSSEGLSDWHLTNTYIYAILLGYAAALKEARGDPSGFPTPEWPLNKTFDNLATADSARAVLPISTPGISIAGTGQKTRDLCRDTNRYLADLVKEHPQRLDFFGALPDWRDVDVTIDEIEFLFSTQKVAVGGDFYTSYGYRLPGDPMFKPSWDKLEDVGALAFMHPSVADIKPLFITNILPQPIVDYPHIMCAVTNGPR